MGEDDGTGEAFDYDLAEKLHMTVARLRAEMPSLERTKWHARGQMQRKLRGLADDTEKALGHGGR